MRLDTGPDRIHTAHLVFWLFALGWAAAKASRPWQLVLVTALGVVSVMGFFEDPAPRTMSWRWGFACSSGCRLCGCRGFAIRPVSVLASSSLHIYLVHWLVYPRWENSYPLFALAASLAAGIAFWASLQPGHGPPRKGGSRELDPIVVPPRRISFLADWFGNHPTLGCVCALSLFAGETHVYDRDASAH
ncbi:MAG: hypothetical protein WKF73_02980 [Nocardioidaceae bacterium]